MIEWISLSQGGKVNAVDPATNTLITDFGNHTAQVANVIPPQRAGRIADIAGATDNTGWCAIDPVTFESKSAPNIHVIGDACIAGAMPKSAFSANAQAKACAARHCHAVAAERPTTPKLINTCYSLAAPGYGILGRRRLPAEERTCWPTSKAPAASARQMRHANSARAKPTMRNPGSLRSRRKSLARRTHRISGPILAGALLALPGFAPRRSCAAMPSSATPSRNRSQARAATLRAGARSSSNAPALASSATAAHFPNRNSRATWRPVFPVPAAAGPRVSFGFGWWMRPASTPRPSCRPIIGSTACTRRHAWRGKPILSAEQIEDIVAYLVTLRK